MRTLCSESHLHGCFLRHHSRVGGLEASLGFQTLSVENGEAEFEVGDLAIIIVSFGFERGILFSDGLQFDLLGCLFGSRGGGSAFLSLAWAGLHFGVCL